MREVRYTSFCHTITQNIKQHTPQTKKLSTVNNYKAFIGASL